MEINQNKGRELLNKWLSGDITYDEELELFGIAAGDPVIREALEGYLGQKEIIPGELPAEIQYAVNPQRSDVIATEKTKVRSLVWIRYAAAAILLLLTLGIVFTQMQNEGQLADPVLVEFDDKQIKSNDAETVIADVDPLEESIVTESAVEQLPALQANKNNKRVTTPAIPADDVGHSETIALADVSNESVNSENAIAPQTENVVQPVSQFTQFVQSEDQLLHEENSDLLVTNGSESLKTEAEDEVVEQEAIAVNDVDLRQGSSLQFFDYEADEQLKRDVQLEAIKQGDQPITAYEIDIKAGIDPEKLDDLSEQGNSIDSADVDQLALQSRANLVNATSAGKSEVVTNEMASSIKITEYKIQKRDITHPPIEDYNSLVRERYKRKAKPENGFYHYKKYLKQATLCLIDEHKNVDYLEEAIIKFRVFNDGNIEFIELFGTQGSDCVKQISTQITAGPKWELAERYESIDVEIPFKVLYPYWY